MSSLKLSKTIREKMKNLLKFCSIAEIITALVLIFFPSVIIQLLFEAELNEIAMLITRFAGICLLCFGIVCWPKQEIIQASWAMFFYNILVTLFFIYIGIHQKWVGILLWPVVGLHFSLSVLLFRGLLAKK